MGSPCSRPACDDEMLGPRHEAVLEPYRMTSRPEIAIAGGKIGPGFACYVMAEACDNHLGNLDVAMEMVRQAKLASADAVKFQHHLPDEEMLPDAPMSDNFQEPLYEFLKKHALK